MVSVYKFIANDRIVLVSKFTSVNVLIIQDVLILTDVFLACRKIKFKVPI